MQTTLSELGIVSSRVALLLRSAEIKPTFHGFVGGPPPPRCQYHVYRRCMKQIDGVVLAGEVTVDR